MEFFQAKSKELISKEKKLIKINVRITTQQYATILKELKKINREIPDYNLSDFIREMINYYAYFEINNKGTKNVRHP